MTGKMYEKIFDTHSQEHLSNYQGSKVESPKEVQFYSAHARALNHTQQHKVNKFLEHNCIEYAGNNTFICKPIPGYNKTTYELTKNDFGGFDCNCQGFQKKLKQFGEGSCSHEGTLFEYFARKRKDEK